MRKNIRHLTVIELWYITIAVKELAIARVLHAAKPTGKIVKALKQKCAKINFATHSRKVKIDRIAWAIAATSSRVPWRSDCLIQVMAAERWMRRLHFPTSFFLGVAKDPSGALRAHAWLRHGETIVAGSTGDGYMTLIEPKPNEETNKAWDSLEGRNFS